jgi:uncharacterized secreted repeat protein (TIGR03808 family)
VVQGNLIRNLVRGRPAGEDQNNIDAFGTSVEADTAVTGNVLDNIEGTGIRAGYGPYLRDVTITSNVVRNTDRGITISVVPGGGTAVIADNLISEARFGAIVGMEWEKTVTGDLSKNGAGQYAHCRSAATACVSFGSSQFQDLGRFSQLSDTQNRARNNGIATIEQVQAMR